MKEIKNWEAIIEKNGEDITALPLPGCIIKGELESEDIRIKAGFIDLSRLTVTDENGEKYLLYGARDSYLGLLNNMIEFSKLNQVENVQPIDLYSKIDEQNKEGEIEK